MDPPGLAPPIERRNPPAAPQVVLVSVWLDAAGSWHARLVSSQAQAHEFSSPFELAQFLMQLPRVRQQAAPGSGGLR